MLVALIFRTLDALRVFDIVYVMKGTDLTTISMSVYNRQQLVDFNKLGFGSSVSVAIFLIISVFTIIYITSSRVKFD
jgi:trehalose/maltose transport system permease protein